MTGLRACVRELREFIFGASYMGGGFASSTVRGSGGSSATPDPSTIHARYGLRRKTGTDIHKAGAPSPGGSKATSKTKLKSKVSLKTPLTKTPNTREPSAQGPNVRGNRAGEKPATGSAGRVR